MLLNPQNKFDHRNQTLMALGAGLLQAGAPRVGQPGPGFGNAIMGALNTSNNVRQGLLGNQTQASAQKMQAQKLAMAQQAHKADMQRQAAARAFFDPTPVPGPGGPTMQSVQSPLQKAYPNATPAQIQQARAEFNATGDAKAALAVFKPKPPERPVSVGAGATLVHPVTGKIIAEGAPKTTTVMQNALAVGHKPGTPGYQEFVRQASMKNPPGTKKAFDTQTKQQVFVTEEQIAASRGRYAPVPSGMKIQSDGQGGFMFVSGGMAQDGGAGLTKPNQSKIQMKQFNSSEELARLTEINAMFKPAYMQLGTRMGMAGAALKDFLNIDLDDATRSELRDYTQFRRASIDNLNTVLNNLSGAAVSPQEAKRIQSSRPNAGTGIFDGDSPTEFKAKMDGITKSLRHAVMRHAYAMKNGLDPLKTGISLDKVPELVERRGREIAELVGKENPRASEQTVDMIVRDRLKQEFGI